MLHCVHGKQQHIALLSEGERDSLRNYKHCPPDPDGGRTYLGSELYNIALLTLTEGFTATWPRLR